MEEEELRRMVLMQLTLPELVTRYKELSVNNAHVITNPGLWEKVSLVEEILLIEFVKERKNRPEEVES